MFARNKLGPGFLHANPFFKGITQTGLAVHKGVVRFAGTIIDNTATHNGSLWKNDLRTFEWAGFGVLVQSVITINIV